MNNHTDLFLFAVKKGSGEISFCCIRKNRNYRLALANGHDSLVAGAFGCGAFRLPSETVAALFNEILSETEFRNKFRKITFAILDKDGEDGKFAPFYKLFNR